MKTLTFALYLGAACFAPAAMAQAPLTVGASTAAPMLRAGMEVPMRTMVELTTNGKNMHAGDRIQLEVAEAVTLNGQVVIAAGTPGMGEITTVRNKGMWGKSGAFNGRVLYIRVGDRQIRMSGTFDDKGKTGTGGVVAAIAFIPVAGFLMTGTSAKLPIGAPVKAFLDEDVPVVLAAGAAPSPLQAVAPAAALAASVAPAGVTPASLTTTPQQ